ncbi:MAG TPA: hypothetical protein VIR79_06045 [Nitrospira sp.]
MRIQITMKRLVLLALVLTIGMWAAPSIYAADALVKGAMVQVSTGALDRQASGAVEDSLKACMARIPATASAGQRMMAEQTCAGEEEIRKVVRDDPKF